MELLAYFVNNLFPDGVIYSLTAFVFLLGLVKCCRPVFRNAAILRRAADMLEEGAKAKLSRPVWHDANFLGKKLQPIWRNFLQSAELAASRGLGCDVAEYVDEDNIITLPGKAALADVIPGICTSMGILGTFVGLYMGLNGLDVMKVDSYVQLTGGISFAFLTSIVGIIASLLFNAINKIAIGRARAAEDAFIGKFYTYAIAQPADSGTQIITYQREQADAMTQFAADMSARMATEIRHAITAAMSPVQRSMDDFMKAATRAQVDGLDLIVGRFIDRMNAVLGDQLHVLGDVIQQTADGQSKAQGDLRNTVDAIGQISQDVVNIHGVSEQVIDKYASFVSNMEYAYQQVGDAQNETTDLLEEISQASLRQSRYLSALQEYQAKLQGSFQEYTLWTDKFVAGLAQSTTNQNESLEHIAKEMRVSAELLQGSYKSFVESIEVGLANALGLFDENMQNLTRQIHGTLSDIKETMVMLEPALRRAVSVTAQHDQEVG